MISIKNNKKLQLLIIVGAVLAVTAVVGVLVGTYCTGWSGFHFYDKPQDGDVKIACVGDSITYGFGVNNWGKNNYPKQLDTLLGEGYCVNNYGHSGATAQADGDQPYYSYSEYEKSVEFDADILILMMGTNDSKPYNWVDEATFKAEYIKLINGYKAQNSDIRNKTRSDRSICRIASRSRRRRLHDQDFRKSSCLYSGIRNPVSRSDRIPGSR